MSIATDAAFVASAAITSATPLLLAGYGELVAQRSGVINVGIEGTMLMGAIAGYAAATWTQQPWAAIPAAVLAGVLFAGLFAITAILFRADQIVAGTAINILAAGASTTVWSLIQGRAPPALFDRARVPVLADVPWVGEALFNQYGLFYVTVLLGAGLFVVQRATRFGLVIRALGDNPDACNAAGIGVLGWRTGAVLFAGGAAGLAGAYLSTMQGHGFQINMTGGQGFLVLALVIFGRWNLAAFTVGTLLFGAIDALQALLASKPNATVHLPHQLFPMLPYVATLIALAVLSKSTASPRTLAQPWPAER